MESRPWLEIIVGGSIALWISLVALLESGVTATAAALWLVAITALISGVGALVFGRRRLGLRIIGAAALMAIAVAIATTGLQQRMLPFCGDGACRPDECTRGCGDCSPATCEDGICTPAIERCDNSPDCACPAGEACAPDRAGDPAGCVPTVCGDGYCDRAEECCTDCGCAKGFTCRDNACYYQPPEVETKQYLLANEIAATSLAANPSLTDPYGTPHALAATVVAVERSTARAANVTFTLGGIARDTVTLGDIRAGGEATATWRLDGSFLATPLTVTEDTVMNLTMTLAYLDGQGTLHTRTARYPVTVLARDSIDQYGHLAFLITPEDIALQGSTSEIWEQLGSRVVFDAQRPAERVRFPKEVLAAGSGNRDELAALVASAFQRAGLEPALVATGIGTLVRVRDRGRAVIVDPARIGQPFADASWSGTAFAVDDIAQVWRARNATVPLSMTDDLIPGASLRIVANHTVTCECASDCSPRVVSIAVVANNGLVDAPLCAVSTIERYGDVVDERVTCVTLAAGERREFRHGWQGTGSCDPSEVTVSFDARA